MTTGSDPLPPLTVYAMAKIIGRAQISIHHYLRRHGIEPVRVEARRKFYAAGTVGTLSQGMRARHGKRRRKPQST